MHFCQFNMPSSGFPHLGVELTQSRNVPHFTRPNLHAIFVLKSTTYS